MVWQNKHTNKQHYIWRGTFVLSFCDVHRILLPNICHISNVRSCPETLWSKMPRTNQWQHMKCLYMSSPIWRRAFWMKYGHKTAESRTTVSNTWWQFPPSGLTLLNSSWECRYRSTCKTRVFIWIIINFDNMFSMFFWNVLHNCTRALHNFSIHCISSHFVNAVTGKKNT